MSGRVRTGLGTVLIGHILFNSSYVVVTVRARLQGWMAAAIFAIALVAMVIAVLVRRRRP